MVVHIAGIHTIGSLGAAHYLANNLPAVFAATEDTSWSMATRCTAVDRHIESSELAAGPSVW